MHTGARLDEHPDQPVVALGGGHVEGGGPRLWVGLVREQAASQPAHAV